MADRLIKNDARRLKCRQFALIGVRVLTPIRQQGIYRRSDMSTRSTSEYSMRGIEGCLLVKSTLLQWLASVAMTALS